MHEVHSKLSHLTQEQLGELVHSYKNGDVPVADLINRFNIDIAISKLHSILPPIIHEDKFCHYCQMNLISEIKPRTPSYSMWTQHPFCPKCNHVLNDHCGCDNCLSIRYKLVENNPWSNNREILLPPAKELTLKEAVFIVSVKNHSSSEGFESVFPFSEKFGSKLAPTSSLIRSITTDLLDKGFLGVSTKSPLAAFAFEGDKDKLHIQGFYPEKATYDFLPFLEADEKRKYLAEINEIIRNNLSDAWWREVPNLWHAIALEECIEYLEYLCVERRYDSMEVGEKLRQTLENLLERYSVSQIFNISWQCARDANDWIRRKGIAAESFPGAVKSILDNKIAQFEARGYTIKKSRRNFDCPQTTVSTVFFDQFTKLGNEAFDSAPFAIEA